MSYKHINDIYNNIVEKEEKENFLNRIFDPRYSKSQERIRHRGYTLSKKIGLFSLNNSLYQNAKLHFFNSSLNELYRYKEYGTDLIFSLGVGIIPLTFSLLSDNEQLIQNVANAGKDLDVPRRNKGSLNLMLQCAMRNDIESLGSAMQAYEKYAINKRWDELQIEFYKSYLAADEIRIKEVLKELESPKIKKQNIFHGEFIDDYLSVLTSAYLKLCWIKGMDIYIESNTVPTEMMPIRPLDKYTIEYPYLEGWNNDDFKKLKSKEEEKVYENLGPYPGKNPTLRSKYVSKDTVRKVVHKFCLQHSEEEKNQLISLIWEAYSNPKDFDGNNEGYVKKYASFPISNSEGKQIYEARPFWSELTEHDDEGFFRYCNHFIIMNETGISHENIELYLEKILVSEKSIGGFIKK